MKPEDKEAMNRYADLKKQEKVLAKEIVDLKPIVVKVMDESEMDIIETDKGTYSIGLRNKFVFPIEIATKEDELKIMKEECEARGEALVEQTRYLIFNSK